MSPTLDIDNDSINLSTLFACARFTASVRYDIRKCTNVLYIAYYDDVQSRLASYLILMTGNALRLRWHQRCRRQKQRAAQLY